MKQELPAIEYIRPDNQQTDHCLDVKKQNHYSRDREQWFHYAYFNYFMPFFPFWQTRHFQTTRSDQKDPHLRGSAPTQLNIVKQEQDNNPPRVLEPVESILPKDRCTNVINSCPSKPERSVEQDHRCENRRRRHNPFYWTKQENRRYLKFIKQNIELFQLPVDQKKSLKVNVIMSLKVKSRNAQQCRSHHQKLVEKYGSIEGILADYQKDMIAQRKCYRKRETSRQQVKLVRVLENKSQKMNTKTVYKR